MMLSFALSYLVNCLTGKTPEISAEQQSQVKMGNTILSVLKKAGFEEKQIRISKNNDTERLEELRFGLTWFLSLLYINLFLFSLPPGPGSGVSFVVLGLPSVYFHELDWNVFRTLSDLSQ